MWPCSAAGATGWVLDPYRFIMTVTRVLASAFTGMSAVIAASPAVQTVMPLRVALTIALHCSRRRDLQA